MDRTTHRLRVEILATFQQRRRWRTTSSTDYRFLAGQRHLALSLTILPSLSTNTVLPRSNESSFCGTLNEKEEFMAEKNLQGLRVAILATDGVEDAELKDPRKALEMQALR